MSDATILDAQRPEPAELTLDELAVLELLDLEVSGPTPDVARMGTSLCTSTTCSSSGGGGSKLI